MGIVLFFLSCEDHVAERTNQFDPNNPNYFFSTLSGRVLDSRTSLPISGCKVSLDNGDTILTDLEGEYSFAGLVHGIHCILFDIDNYILEKDTLNIDYNTSSKYDKLIIEDAPFLEISDTVLVCLPNESVKNVTLYNFGTKILDWELSHDEESVIADINSGTIGPGQSQNIVFEINKHMLETGTHNVIIGFNSNGGNHSLNLNIIVEPILVVNADSLWFNIDELTSLFFITNPGGGTIDFYITENISWLTLSQYNGQIEDDTLYVEATVDTNFLESGDNWGSIQISSESEIITITSSIYLPFPPSLLLSNDILNFGIGIENMTFTISNGGDGVLIWNIPETENWFSVNPENGETINLGTLVNVSVNRFFLYEGSYSFNMPINTNAQNSEIEINLDVLPILQVSESNFYFDGSTNQLSFEISNVGSGIMPWSISVDDNWIICSDDEGEITDETVQINVNVNQSGLANGYYSSSINISTGNDEYVIDVDMYVPQPPVLVVSNNDLEFGNQTDELNLFISNGGEGSLTWSISEDIPWLSVSQLSGITADEQEQITVTINTDALSSGEYSDSFIITSNGGNELVNITLYLIEEFFEDFADISDWSGDIGDNGWDIINSNYCENPPCANVYFCATCDEEDAQINRQVWVEQGMLLQIYTFTYWDFDLKIYLGGSLIIDSSISYGEENLSHTITSSGQFQLSIVSEYNNLGSGYIDNLSITY